MSLRIEDIHRKSQEEITLTGYKSGLIVLVICLLQVCENMTLIIFLTLLHLQIEFLLQWIIT